MTYELKTLPVLGCWWEAVNFESTLFQGIDIDIGIDRPESKGGIIPSNIYQSLPDEAFTLQPLLDMPESKGGSIPVNDDELLAMLYVPGPGEWGETDRDTCCDRLLKCLQQVSIKVTR